MKSCVNCKKTQKVEECFLCVNKLLAGKKQRDKKEEREDVKQHFKAMKRKADHDEMRQDMLKSKLK